MKIFDWNPCFSKILVDFVDSLFKNNPGSQTLAKKVWGKTLKNMRKLPKVWGKNIKQIWTCMCTLFRQFLMLNSCMSALLSDFKNDFGGFPIIAHSPLTSSNDNGWRFLKNISCWLKNFEKYVIFRKYMVENEVLIKFIKSWGNREFFSKTWGKIWVMR